MPATSPSSEHAPAGWRGPVSAGLLVVYAAIAVLMRLPVWASPGSTVAGAGGDPLQSSWFLQWLPFAATHHSNPLLTDHLNAPAGVNLLWNTAEPAAALVLWPVTVLASPFVSYNVLVTVAMAGGAWCAYHLVRRYVALVWAAACGGLFFGFSPMMVAEGAGHAQVIASAIAIPVVALLLDEVLVRQRRRWWIAGGLLGLVLAAQFFVFEEYFATAIIVGAVLTLVLLVTQRRRFRSHRDHAVRGLAVAAVVVAAAIAYPVWLQLFGPDAVHGSVHSPSSYSTDLANFVIPTTLTAAGSGWFHSIASNFPGNPSEQLAYLGLPMLALLVVTAVRRRHDPVTRTAFLVALIVALFSLGPQLVVAGHRLPVLLPWAVPTKTPLLRNILPARLIMYVDLAAAVLFAQALQDLWRAGRRWWRPALVAAVCLLPLAPQLPLPYQTLQIPAFFTSATAQRIPVDAAVYAIPWPESIHMDAMDGQTATGYRYRLFGGYFLGPAAIGQDALPEAANQLTAGAATTLDPRLLARLRAQLSAAHCDLIMLTPTPNQAAIAAYLSSVFGAPLIDAGGVILWRFH